jgi:RecB family endonuclease NucS
MSDEVEIAEPISIREAGLDEFWLQNQIWKNPSCLGLGDLDTIAKEKKQSGGRLDILLKDSDDDSMYEVEIMLGETDETHIIRTIEYWDNEKRRWPQRQHFAV